MICRRCAHPTPPDSAQTVRRESKESEPYAKQRKQREKSKRAKQKEATQKRQAASKAKRGERRQGQARQGKAKHGYITARNNESKAKQAKLPTAVSMPNFTSKTKVNY